MDMKVPWIFFFPAKLVLHLPHQKSGSVVTSAGEPSTVGMTMMNTLHQY